MIREFTQSVPARETGKAWAQDHQRLEKEFGFTVVETGEWSEPDHTGMVTRVLKVA